MKTIKLKDEKGEHIYPFTVAKAVIGLTDKISEAISGIKSNSNNDTLGNEEDVPLGTLGVGTYTNSKFVSSGSTSVAMESFFLLPYLGVVFHFKLPEDIVVDVYYGNYHGTSGTTCYFGENVYKDIQNGHNFYFPFDIKYTKEYSDDTDGSNAYYYGLVFRKKDGSDISEAEISNYVTDGSIKITYNNPYGNIMERNTPAMDNVAAARMYFALGSPKRFNDIYRRNR